jgi:hypothetical protein
MDYKHVICHKILYLISFKIVYLEHKKVTRRIEKIESALFALSLIFRQYL